MKKILVCAIVATIAISGTSVTAHAYTPLYRPVSIKIPTITKVILPSGVEEAARKAGSEAAQKVIEDMKKETAESK